MSGIYLHIPFCKQACHYCDFHFSTSMRNKDAIVAAICREAVLRQDYLGQEPVGTVYFGGGTPSLLSQAELLQIFETLHHYYPILPDAEITLEANPDDLMPAKLRELQATPVNRLSIGLQSFHDPHLRLMNRAHTAGESLTSVQEAQQAGFSNITVDLIYGIPAPDHSLWLRDLDQLFRLEVQHVSCYALTIEPQTVFGHRTRKGTFTPGEEEFVARQFEILTERMREEGFGQYEISNFCRPGFESRHNGNYWRQVPYLGLGPSAHSFRGASRQYNVASNARYLQALQQDQIPATVEELTPEDQANEYVMTTLRTSWGCDLRVVRERYGLDLAATQAPYLRDLAERGLLRREEEVLYLTDPGKLLADQIALDLFVLPAGE
ncbi:radical SAM family heme chaperone HemW [soil metagenome]